MNTILEPTTNPYVGPRTFSQEQRHLFFGREREGRDLLARVLSERLVLFYAQSGAGKSSLINTRLIPGLREIGYAVLPVGRVGGEVLAGVEGIDNVYLFNLMLSIAQTETDPGRFAGLTLSRFLARLSSEDGQHYAYGEAAVPPPGASANGAAPVQPYVLIIDQFEELITGHPGRWTERAEFFRQLNGAMLDDPNLWVVLALREDYIAPIEPYAPLLADRMRARFYMERMGVDAALEAIRSPGELGGRPFAPGIAETLRNDLCQVRVPGQAETVTGQYVEPVQLQVVCYQLWENITGRPPGPISADNLAEAGDVNQALSRFYETTLQDVLAGSAAIGVSEQQLRTWFDEELITEAGTRGLVCQDEEETGGLPNAMVRSLQSHWLVRSEIRSGTTWIELVHDRFVEPIRTSNAVWFPAHLSALQRQAALWDEQGRSSGLLLREAALAEAEAWAAGHSDELGHYEREFLVACREAHEAAERERRQSRRMRLLAIVAVTVAVVAVIAAVFGVTGQHQARKAEESAVAQAARALNAEATANAERAIAMGNANLAATREVEARAARATAVAEKQRADEKAAEAESEKERAVRQSRRAKARRTCSQFPGRACQVDLRPIIGAIAGTPSCLHYVASGWVRGSVRR